jgi:predicted DCC family thiol-disulfide oxidoreductase YuxK
MRTTPHHVLFDGNCGLCGDIVQDMQQSVGAERFAFLTVQSPAGSELAAAHGIDPADPQSLLLVKHDRAFLKSSAALEIARDLSGWRWRFLRLIACLPRSWRDVGYDWIARNRHRYRSRCG